jgi:hypothetical protein
MTMLALKPYDPSTRPWAGASSWSETEPDWSRQWYNRQIGFLLQHELDGWSDCEQISTTIAQEESDAEIEDVVRKYFPDSMLETS